MPATRRRRLLRRALPVIVLVMLAMPFAVDAWVKRATRSLLYSRVEDIPHNKVGLLLGTSRHGAGGGLNYFYLYRIRAAVALYKAGKIDYILISGDNGRKEYSEPEDMQADLIAAGVPADRIVLDYAGFRTLDSILRCRKVFGQSSYTIISQPFHNERAAFIARWKGMDVVAFNAQDVGGDGHTQMQIREKFARVKMVLDLVFGKGPKFYGEPVPVGGPTTLRL